jgi:DNA polymerase III gamma/tau subunit
LFDECHQITPVAQEAFLKETEQPPPHVFFIFCTTEPESLKVTFKRRSFIGEVKPLTRSEVTALIKDVLEAEKITDFPEEVTKKVALSCNGSPGIALSLLDAVIDIEDNKLALEVIEDRTVSETGINKLCYALLDNRLTEDEKWRQVKSMIQNLPAEPESNRRAILGYFNAVMLGDRMPPTAPEIMSLFLDNYYSSGKSGLILSCYLACKVRV